LQKFIPQLDHLFNAGFNALCLLSQLCQPYLTLLVRSLLADFADLVYLRFQLDCCGMHLCDLLFGLNHFSFEGAYEHNHGLLLLFLVLHEVMFCSLPLGHLDLLKISLSN
jgi:hypothetical protein